MTYPIGFVRGRVSCWLPLPKERASATRWSSAPKGIWSVRAALIWALSMESESKLFRTAPVAFRYAEMSASFDRYAAARISGEEAEAEFAELKAQQALFADLTRRLVDDGMVALGPRCVGARRRGTQPPPPSLKVAPWRGTTGSKISLESCQLEAPAPRLDRSIEPARAFSFPRRAQLVLLKPGRDGGHEPWVTILNASGTSRLAPTAGELDVSSPAHAGH